MEDHNRQLQQTVLFEKCSRIYSEANEQNAKVCIAYIARAIRHFDAMGDRTYFSMLLADLKNTYWYVK